jgi:hypothetical protein
VPVLLLLLLRHFAAAAAAAVVVALYRVCRVSTMSLRRRSGRRSRSWRRNTPSSTVRGKGGGATYCSCRINDSREEEVTLSRVCGEMSRACGEEGHARGSVK